MENKLTWREAEDAMERGELVRSGKFTYRLSANGRLEHKSDVDNASWCECFTNHFGLRSLKWERVPKTPRVHELPAKWRDGTAGYSSQLWSCAEELEAALREDELVSLKGVKVCEINSAWQADPSTTGAISFTLNYLRERSKR